MALYRNEPERAGAVRMALFISYARDDRQFADDLREHLRELEVWIDRSSLLPGQDWAEEIENQISMADAVIVAISPASCDSKYVTFEWSFALGRGVPVIPVMIAATAADEIHPRLRSQPVHDFKGEDWHTLASLVGETLTTASAGHLDGRRAAERIVAYIDRMKGGRRMVGFPGIRQHIDSEYSDAFLRRVLRQHTDLVVPATLAGDIPGMKNA